MIKTQKKAMVVGSAIVDIIMHVDDAFVAHMGLEKGDMTIVDTAFFDHVFREQNDQEYLEAPGGSATNTLFLLGHLGHGTRLVTMTGDDRYGQMYRSAQNTIDGDATYIHKSSALPTGRCISLVTDDSERTMCTNVGAADLLSAQHCPKESFVGMDIVHLEGYLIFNKELFTHALQQARSADVAVSVGISASGIAEGFRNVFFDEILPRSDIFFANEEEAMILTRTTTPHEALEDLSKRVCVAVVTRGAKGATAARGRHRATMPAREVRLVDTTGAGDAFAGGFLHGFLTGASLEHSLAWGVCAGTEAVTIDGAQLSQKNINHIVQQCT